MRPHHAVETNNGTFVVCHQPMTQRGNRAQTFLRQCFGIASVVSEVNESGDVVRKFATCSSRLKWPRYLSTFASRHWLVSDRTKDCVYVLDETLAFREILLDSKRSELKTHKPEKSCYVQDKQLLIVSLREKHGGFIVYSDVVIKRSRRRGTTASRNNAEESRRLTTPV